MYASQIFTYLAATLLALSSTALHAQQDEWQSLFDGKSLDGWERVGNEKSVWEVGGTGGKIERRKKT